jgi:lipoprotein-anchoring transpeptidase ErfK/SrfK
VPGRHFEVSLMNAKPAPSRTLAASGALAIAALVGAAAIDPAAAQYYGNQYGRSSPYGSPYGYPYARDQYGRPVDHYGRPIQRAPQPGRETKRDPAGPASGSAPLLAIVSLNDQRVTVYDANGRKMLQSPVSTGSTNYETPVGIYSVVQKKEQHQSNQYEDGNMPFMQRITWTGIALHAGVLPGHPASHGCVRLPIAFAERLFGLTDIGLRVIVVRDDMAPGEIAHAALFRPSLTRREAALSPPANVRVSAPGAELAVAPPPGSPKLVEFLKAKAAAKSAEAEAATKKATAAKQVAARKAAEAAPAAKAVKAAEANQERAREALQKAEQALTAATSAANAPAPESDTQTAKAEAAKEKAAARLAETQTARERAAAKLAEADQQLESAKAQAQAKAEAAEAADNELKAAEAAREAAVETAEETSRQTSPISVFISRKTQRLYIRKGYHPLYEGPVTIRDADKPIGSYVFTALNYAEENSDVRWIVTSLYGASGRQEQAAPAKGQRPRNEARAGDANPSDIAGARAALDRISIPKDTLERINEVVLPGSSLIVSDEGLSLETGKDTDFVVLMSGEPQGGIKTRRREPMMRYRDGDDFWGGGGGGNKRGGGGCMFLFGC